MTVLVGTETEIPEYYGMTAFRRGYVFFGIVKIYDMKTGSMHGELAWSSDGISWEMHPGHTSFISRGRKGSWDGGMATAAKSPVIDGNGMLFFCGGFPLDHNQMAEENVGSIGLMGGRDRMVGMRPNTEAEGTILTACYSNGTQTYSSTLPFKRIAVELFWRSSGLTTTGRLPVSPWRTATGLAALVSRRGSHGGDAASQRPPETSSGYSSS